MWSNIPRDLKYVENRLLTFDATDRDGLLPELLACFESQCAGGKSYHLALPNKQQAEVTFWDSHSVDGDVEALSVTLNLMPLLDDPDLPLLEFLRQLQVEANEQSMARLEAVCDLSVTAHEPRRRRKTPKR